MTPGDPRHGTVAGLSAHRRDGEVPCARCKEAKARYEKRRRYDADQKNRRVMPSLGAQRRIRALQALGWSLAVIAREAGWNSPQALQYVMRSGSIYRGSWTRIADVYERLSMQVPPLTSGSIRARNRAKRLGYLPPLAWDDIDNDPAPAEVTHMRHRSSDLLAEYEHLIACGESHAQALRQLGVQPDAIHTARIRARRSNAA